MKSFYFVSIFEECDTDLVSEMDNGDGGEGGGVRGVAVSKWTPPQLSPFIATFKCKEHGFHFSPIQCDLMIKIGQNLDEF